MIRLCKNGRKPSDCVVEPHLLYVAPDSGKILMRLRARLLLYYVASHYFYNEQK
jgi:hypothetical protein